MQNKKYMDLAIISKIISPLVTLVSKGLVWGKNEIEKDYTNFRKLRSLNLNNKLEDKPLSIYLESIYRYEEIKGEEMAKLFYLDKAFEAFNEFYNLGEEHSLYSKLDLTLHTSKNVDSLKNKIINIQEETNLFLNIFKTVLKEASPQSNLEILSKVNNIQEFLTERNQPLPSDYDFNQHIQEPVNKIPRTLNAYNNQNNNSLSGELERTDLMTALLSSQRIILLANGGMGKTVELQKIATNKSISSVYGFTPLYKNFKAYTNQKLQDYLPDNWDKVPESELLLILDGLDEVRNSEFLTAIRNINSFVEDYPKVRIIISCRTNHLDISLEQFGDSFIPFYLEGVNVYSKEVKAYINNNYDVNYEDFVHTVYENGYLDLTENPFYLDKMLEIYAKERVLQEGRAQLFENFVLLNIKFDQEKYNLTIDDIRYKEAKIISTLEIIALSMECLGKNEITINELAEVINLEKDLEIIKFTKSFKKIEEGNTEKWQFDHRLIQEFLAARKLSQLPFDKIVEFISFAGNKKVIPSWVNTVTFLFSLIVDPVEFNKLISWIIDNDKDLIIKVEKEKLPDELRIKIFQEIFKHYQKYDVWINSRKFNDIELARFGQSTLNTEFLIKIVEDNTSSITTRLNAIHLLSHFEISDGPTKQNIKKLLLENIQNSSNDPNSIHTTIYAFKYLNFTDSETIKQLMDLVGTRKNQYVRSAMYAVLLKSQSLEDYVDYLIEGEKIKEIKIEGERDEVSLMDEGLNLSECLKRIKSLEGIRKLTEFISDNSRFEYGYDSNKIIKAIIDNAISIYPKENAVFDYILKWFLKDIRGFRTEKLSLINTFFDETDTRTKAFKLIWESKEIDERDRSLAISKLLDTGLISFVFEEYNKGKVTGEELKSIYFDLSWVQNGIRDKFEDLINEKTDIRVSKTPPIDYVAIRKQKTVEDFNLLFNEEQFKKEVFNVFQEQGKEELTFDELFEIRKENLRTTDLEDYVSISALDLLRNLTGQGQKINKQWITDWFEKENVLTWFRISTIKQYVSNNKDLEVSSDQVKYIKDWCLENISKVDFKNSITVTEGDNISFKQLPYLIWYFGKRFNLDFSKEILLDMISFNFFDEESLSGIEYLSKKLTSEEITQRMLENLKAGIPSTFVLKTHIQFLSENKIKDSYNLIIEEIINTKRSDYHRGEFLDIYFDLTKDIEGLKTLMAKADPTIKWKAVDKLIKSNEEKFVEDFLLKELQTEIDISDRGKIAEILVGFQNLKGLEEYVAWIKNEVTSEIDMRRANCLKNLTNKEAVPFLIELLELGYSKQIAVNSFERYISYVISSLQNIAMVSEENLRLVKSALEDFLKENITKFENAKYLIHTIEGLEDQFFNSRAQQLTIKEVKEKLKLI